MPESVPQTIEVPTSESALAEWFAEGVRAELEALEDQQRAQRYELINGDQVEAQGESSAIYRFVVADGARLPEDSSGLLTIGDERLQADVLGQVGNQITVLIQTATRLPNRIPRALFNVDDAALLRKLAEFLEGIATSNGSGLTTGVFHPSSQPTGFADLPADPAIDAVTGEHRRALQQALGSPITFIWGPPGTGKTYGIAHLITALLRAGERILMTSHTHAAVDAALYETITGPLEEDSTVDAGQIVRVGRTTDPKIPADVKLEGITERRAAEIAERIAGLETEAAPLVERRAQLDASLALWNTVHDLERRRQVAVEETRSLAVQAQRIERSIREGQQQLVGFRESLERAQRAWFRKATKVHDAQQSLDRQHRDVTDLENEGSNISLQRVQATERVDALTAQLADAKDACREIEAEASLRAAHDTNEAALSTLEAQIQAARSELSHIEEQVIAEASVIFATLTKLYIGGALENQHFDAVIIDEVSMAMPPLLLVAALRAGTRVVLVGDFLQLPPIVRSDDPLSDERLGTDVFRLARLANGNRPADGAPAMAKLRTQRRMVPGVADLARHLAYGLTGITDHPSVLMRQPAEWMHWLPDAPLVFIDTADLHCWSGKQPGSQSRFNFYSAHIALSVAARCAAQLAKPPPGERPPIGIVTPYAAQRRILTRLVADLDLPAWAAAGTVHTFQGSQAELVIFDSVLDEPYYSAMLCNPKVTEDVIRQLNVAVTRARDRLVFVGSSEWLNRNAKAASGLGMLWGFFTDNAALVPASDVVSDLPGGWPMVGEDTWTLAELSDGPAYEILDESSFFERFEADLARAAEAVFGLVPFFGEYRWPRVEPWIRDVLQRGVEVTLVTPSLRDAPNARYVEAAIANLRSNGAVVITSEGLHGKDIVIDGRVHYTGSLNWASHRGRSEIMHRTASQGHAALVLRYLQARYIRDAAIHEDGTPRQCPKCGGPTQVVNQRRQHGFWDRQSMKVGCANPDCRDYLRNIDERAPFREIPRCQADGQTKYRRRKYGRGERWQCPKHARDCEGYKVVPGDPEP